MARSKGTIPTGAKAPTQDNIPPAYRGTISAAEAEGVDGTTAGSLGESGPLDPPSNGELERAQQGFRSLIAGPGVHVP
jgi:hypothetical protein